MELTVKFVLFLLLSVIGTCYPGFIKSGKGDSLCEIRFLTIGAAFNGTEGCKSLSIKHVNFTEPSKELLTRLTNGLDAFRMTDINVDSFDLPPKLRALEVTISTTKIVIDKTASYSLEQIKLQKMPQLPDDIGKLHSLRSFYSKYIYAANINLAEFSQMTQLENFRLGQCASLTISKPLPSLRTMIITDTLVMVSNDAPCEFLQLEVLRLENTSLSEIPKTFTTCPNLTYVFFTHGNLGRFALDVFAEMNQLQQLDLQYNQISHMTTQKKVILPRLELLVLDYNFITELDTTLWAMPALKVLSLSYNLLQRVDGLLALGTANTNYIMMENPWDCEWLVETGMKIPGMQIYVVKGSCYAYAKEIPPNIEGYHHW